MSINLKREITLETGLKATATFAYILVVISMCYVLIGAGVGMKAEQIPSEYQQYVTINK